MWLFTKFENERTLEQFWKTCKFEQTTVESAYKMKFLKNWFFNYKQISFFHLF